MKESGGICEGILDCSFKTTFFFYMVPFSGRNDLFLSVHEQHPGDFTGVERKHSMADMTQGQFWLFNLSESLVWTPLFQEARRISLMKKSIPHWGGHWSSVRG